MAPHIKTKAMFYLLVTYLLIPLLLLLLNIMPPVRKLKTSPVLPSPLISGNGNGAIRLTFFDTFWTALPPIQRLFLFQNPTQYSFPYIVKSLRSSLSATLSNYLPLAGKLSYNPESDDVFIDCSASSIGDGVVFIEAESDYDLVKLATDEVHDTEAFLQLVPDIAAHILPAPALGVQVTEFADGGVALGLSLHHSASDGYGVWRFIEAWTAACRSLIGGEEVGPLATACYDRSVIKHPKVDEIARKCAKQMAPDLPVTSTPVIPLEGRLMLLRKTFTISASMIKQLKRKATITENNQIEVEHVSRPPSTFVGLAAQSWISALHAKSAKPEESAFLFFLADCRNRLNPPLEEGFVGNCVKPCYVVANVSDVLDEKNGLRNTCMIIKKAIDDCLRDPFKDCEEWVSTFVKLSNLKMVNVAASPRFKVYETDFGFGKSSRVELVSMNLDGEVALVGGKEEGSVQVSVAISPQLADAFVTKFFDFLD